MGPAETLGSATTIVFTKAGSIVDGDLVCLFVNNASASTITPPSGFAALPSASNESAFLWKIAASEPSSWTVTFSAAGFINGLGCAVETNTYSTSDPFGLISAGAELVTRNTQVGSGLTPTATGVTTVQDDNLLLAAYMGTVGNASTTAPTGFTQIGTSNDWDWLFSGSQVSAGATGNKTTNGGTWNSSETMHNFLVAVQPGSVGASFGWPSLSRRWL